jgi:hypothetical protein
MTCLQLRRSVAAFTLTSILSLLPLASVDAAARARGDHGRAPRIEVRKEPQTSGIKGLVLLLLEKAGVKMDPNGLVTYPDSNGPH